MSFIHIESVSCPTILILSVDSGLLMSAEMFMMTSGKLSPGLTRPISFCLRLLCKCHSAIAEASSHLQLYGIKPKVRSFATACAWQGSSALAGLDPRAHHQSSSPASESGLSPGVSAESMQVSWFWTSADAVPIPKKHKLCGRGWGESPKLP